MEVSDKSEVSELETSGEESMGSNADSESSAKPTKKRAAIAAIVVAIAVVALLVGVLVYNQQEEAKQKAEQEAFDNAVHAVYSDYEGKINFATSGIEALDHAGRLNSIKALEDMKSSINKDSLILHDGEVYGYDDLIKRIDDSISTLKNSTIDDYNKAISDADIDVNAEGVTKEQIQEKIDALNAVKALIDTDKTVVIVLTDKEYSDSIANIDSKVTAYQTKIDEIVAAEEAAAAQAAAEAQAATSYNGGSSYSGGSDYSYDGGSSYSGGGSDYSGGDGHFNNNSGGTGWVDGVWIPPTPEQQHAWANGERLD